MSLDHDSPIKANIQPISSALLLASGEQRVPNARRDKQWAPLFCPRQFAAENENMDMDQFKLSDAQLKNYAIAIVSLRRKFEKEAMNEADPEEFPNVIA